MLSKKKKIVVLVGMVALLVVTGVLNIVLNNNVNDRPTDAGQYQTLFQMYRADRTATRNATKLSLEAIIANEASSAEAVAAAEAQRLELTLIMEKELVLEGLVRAIGFSDAFITMSTANINVIVRAEALTEDEANRILSIIVDETGRSAQNVIIIPLRANQG